MRAFFDFCISVLYGLSAEGTKIIDLLNSYPEINGVQIIDYTFGELMFGVGLPTFLVFSVIKYFKNIIL